MHNAKRGLGKGLSALIPQTGIFTGGRTIVNLEIHSVQVNPRQPRSNFNKENLQDLANSIKEQGVIEPILVRMRSGKYELVAGERRLRAAKLAGLAMIPSIIKEFSDQQSLELAIVENLQREDLNAMDEAQGYNKLITEFNLTQEEVAKKIGKNRSTIANMLRLLSLPEKVKQSLAKDEISFGHARALLSIDNEEKQLELLKQIKKNNLNVRDVEVLSGAPMAGAKPKTKRKRAFTQNTELNALVEKLTTHFGTKVKILGSQQRGRIEIDYFSKEDLDRILEMIWQDQHDKFLSATQAVQ